jgi:aryl-alcohol dehydrogenase-like predicted oxidoreductase
MPVAVAVDASVLGWVTGPDDAALILDRFHAAGGNLVSTADHYAGGRSEVMIGSWLATVDRDAVIVATKVGRHPDSPGLERRAMERSVDASLERLRTDHIDLLSFDGDLFPGDPLEAFETVDRLVRAGKVRFLGAAHFDGDRVRALNAAAEPARFPTFRALLAEYNLMARGRAERELLPVAAEIGAGFVALLPLASGFLTGRVRSRDDLPADGLFNGAERHLGRRGSRVLATLVEIAEEHGTRPAAVALAWLLARPGVTAAAVRTYDLEVLEDSQTASTLALSRHQIARLAEASSEQKSRNPHLRNDSAALP